MGKLQVNGSVNIQDLLTLKSGTDAYTTPSIAFGTDVLIGYGSTIKSLGIYSSNKIYLRPNNGTLGYGDGIELSTTSLIPTKNNTVALGNSTHKWSSIYATTFHGSLSGNADTATKLKTARTISLTGSVTGSGTFDGSGNLSIATTTNHTHSYLPLSGGTVTGTLTLSRSTDASGTADKKPALIVGGASTAQHLEFDGNEIMSKSDGTTPTTLSLNANGGLVSIGDGGLKVNGDIEASFIFNTPNIRSQSGACPTAGWYKICTMSVAYATCPAAYLIYVGNDQYATHPTSKVVLLTWAGGFVNLTKLGGCGGDAISKIGVDINDKTITVKVNITHSVKNAYYASTTPISGNICSSDIAFTSSTAPGYSINI